MMIIINNSQNSRTYKHWQKLLVQLLHWGLAWHTHIVRIILWLIVVIFNKINVQLCSKWLLIPYNYTLISFIVSHKYMNIVLGGYWTRMRCTLITYAETQIIISQLSLKRCEPRQSPSSLQRHCCLGNLPPYWNVSAVTFWNEVSHPQLHDLLAQPS